MFPSGKLLAKLLVLCTLFFLAEGQSQVQHGKINFTVTPASDSLHCTNVRYPQVFSSSGKVRVLASISHEKETLSVHDSAVVYTTDVTQNGFRVCVLESGLGTNGSVIVNWVAFRGTPSGALGGTASFNAFTSGTKCERVNFAQRFPSIPKVLATVHHDGSSRSQNAMNIWIEEQMEDHLRVCVREVKTFDGKHQNIKVDWLAFAQGIGELKFHGKLLFENGGAPKEEDNFAFCKVLNFTDTFYAPPVVMVTVNHLYDSKNVYSVKPENNVLNTWVEEITVSSLRVCIKDLAGMESQHDPVTVDYTIIGDLDPCINVSCNYFAVCKAFGPRDAQCICVNDCPSFEEPVCSSNGTTHDNECVFQREMCHLRANFTVYHPGDCAGFPSQKGRHRLRHNPVWAEAVCEEVPLAPYVFYPDKPVHIQVSVNHVNFSDPAYVHEAVVGWVEEIMDDNFTVCVTQAGRNEKRNGETFATVDWLAYQGAPDGGVSGELDMPTWWTGTSCRTVSLPAGKFKSAPTVLVSVEHERRGVKHDASSVWVEDLTTSSLKICVRELQNFDGAHQSIHVDWIAFEELHRPLLREHGAIYFSNGNKPSQDLNYAFCEDVVFKKHYNDSPEVLLSANHSSSGGNLNPIYNSISAWAEYINKTGFRACVKELFVQQHDPLWVSYAVMTDVCEPGWIFYNGSCYFTSDTCKTWPNASTTCRAMGANLAAIESQEENVYIQQRHNGDKAWIGLNDIATEGLFTWVDGCPDKFRYWAQNQPNNFRGEDCVHTLGAGHGYTWNDVDCSTCHRFTCKKDYDECTSSPCLNGGTCVNGKRKFSCICPRTHVGKTCQDLRYHKNCAELYTSGKRISDVYTIDPDGSGAFDVFCDQTTAGGGWTVFQKRLDGSVDFYRGWTDYKRGFGNLKGEFWLGLDKIHRLTNSGRYKLRVELQEFGGNRAYAEYDMFAITSEKAKYQLSLGTYSGTAGDSLYIHRGYSFSTKDQDNDGSSGSSCAVTYKGAWWYTSCHHSNLNGVYHHGSHSSYADGVNWYTWNGHYYSAKRAEMMIRPETF